MRWPWQWFMRKGRDDCEAERARAEAERKLAEAHQLRPEVHKAASELAWLIEQAMRRPR